KDLEGSALPSQKIPKFLRGPRAHAIREFTCRRPGRFDAELPHHENLCPAAWREEVGYRVQNKVVFLGQLLDIVLDHRRSADDLDVDRHAPAVWRAGRSGGEMSGRTALILMIR